MGIALQLISQIVCGYKAHSLVVDDADQDLAKRFVMEANSMIQNVVEEVKIRRRCRRNANESYDDESFTMLEAFDIFLRNSVLEKFMGNVNRVLAARRKELESLDELRGVIVLHVLAASYSSSVSTIASPQNEDFFFQLDIAAARYADIWAAFSCTKEKRQRVEYCYTGWSNCPTRGNALITELENELAAVNRTLLYVQGATIFALNDDHKRLSSRAVTELMNLSQINNPKKALGTVNNAHCSSLNPVFLASHYSRPREQQIHVWERLVQLIQGVPTSGAIAPMTDAIFAADRGYNAKETIEFVNERLCATGLGTHKRSLDYPFVFGDGPIAKKHKGMAVSEKGFRAIYSAKRKPASNSGRPVEAAVYRESFSGRIAAVYHNDERRFSAHKFTLIPKNGFRGGLDTAKMESMHMVFDRYNASRVSRSTARDELQRRENSAARMKVDQVLRSVQKMTALQSEDPGWFLARAFMFTSRTSHSFIRKMAANFSANLRGLAYSVRGRVISHLAAPLPSNVIEVESLLNRHWEEVLDLLNIQRDTAAGGNITMDAVTTILNISESALRAMRKEEINNLLGNVAAEAAVD